MNEQLRQKKAWVFDLDGTLTVPVHDFDHMRRELGMSDNADILKTLAQTPEPERIALTRKLDELEAFYAQQALPAQGVKPLIEYLARQQLALGIFTRNTKEMAILSLEAIGVESYFSDEMIIGRDEAPHKPEPQGLFTMMSHWQLSCDELVMVGDYKFDLEVGRNANVTTVHVSSDQQRWPDLTDYFYPNLSKLLAVL